MNIQRIVSQVMQKHFYDKLGGVKVQIVYPSDESVHEISYQGKPGSIEGHLANFGKYQYGTSITGPVYQLRVNANACERMDESEQAYARENGLAYNGFVIVEPGSCSLETKARHVEEMGGQVALIMAQGQSGIAGEPQDDKEIVDEAVHSLMYDGTGASVHIPTILISQATGTQLIRVLNEADSTKVILKADFETTARQFGGVEYELFYGSILDLSDDLILSIYQYQHALGQSAKFIPRIKTFNCEFCPDEVKETQCIDNGTYCFYLPEMDANQSKDKHIAILHENLRQRCLYEMVDEYDDSDRHLFLNYLFDVKRSCLDRHGNVHHRCSKQVMEALGINWQSIQNCIDFEKGQQRNKTAMGDFFEEDREKIVEYGITLTPSVVINGHPFRGRLEGSAIFRQVCQSYKPGQVPLVCTNDYNVLPELGTLDDFVVTPGYMTHSVIMIVLAVVLLNICAIIYCTKRRKNEENRIRNEVQMHVDQYFKLQQSELERNPGSSY